MSEDQDSGPAPGPAGEPHPDIEAQFTDLEEGTLPAADAGRVREHLAGCPACAAAHAEFKRTLAALSGLGKVAAPAGLPGAVEETIHRRSGGRFFGRRAFGDRIPFEVLALIALVVIVALFLFARSSSTGSLRIEPDPRTAPVEGAEEVVPRP
jgi:anti-sigma factor RsiW